MMFFVKFVGLLLCVGVLAFGGYKTAQEIQLDEMIGEIETVMQSTTLLPPVVTPGDDDPETPPEGEEVPGGDVDDSGTADGDDSGTAGGDDSGTAGGDTESGNTPENETLSTDAALEAFGGLYDNNDPDFSNMNKEFFMGVLEGVLNASSDNTEPEPPGEDEPDFDESFEDDFATEFNPDEFVPDVQEPEEDQTSIDTNEIIIDVAGSYYQNLQQGIQNNIEANKDASEEEKKASRDEFVQKEAEAFAGLINIATKPEETTEEKLVQSVDAVLNSNVCLNTVTQTVNNNESLAQTVQSATENLDESVKNDIEDKINEALANNPEMESQYSDLASLFGITLGGSTTSTPDVNG